MRKFIREVQVLNSGDYLFWKLYVKEGYSVRVSFRASKSVDLFCMSLENYDSWCVEDLSKIVWSRESVAEFMGMVTLPFECDWVFVAVNKGDVTSIIRSNFSSVRQPEWLG